MKLIEKLPLWLQKLWDLKPKLARQAEKSLADFETEKFLIETKHKNLLESVKSIKNECPKH